MNEILKYDSEFNEDKFKTYVDNVFIQIHLAIMQQDLERIKHFVNAQVYHELVDRVDALKKEQVKQIFDEINVKNTTIENYVVEDNMMDITVHIVSRYMDYIINEEGRVIRGVDTYRVEKDNYLHFQKKIDAQEQGTVRKCPGCGASINVNKNGKCEYCGTTYNLQDKDWIITSLITR